MDRRKTLGQRGEAAAAAFLIKRGWQIIAKNYRINHFEIDLIASNNGAIALFEIKTRAESATSFPINPKQQKTLGLAHYKFCEINKLNPEQVSYNLLLINYFNHRASLEYYPNFLE